MTGVTSRSSGERPRSLAAEWRRRHYPGPVPAVAAEMWRHGRWLTPAEMLDEVAPSYRHAISRFRIAHSKALGLPVVEWSHLDVQLHVLVEAGPEVPAPLSVATLSLASSGAWHLYEAGGDRLLTGHGSPGGWGPGRPLAEVSDPSGDREVWIQFAGGDSRRVLLASLPDHAAAEAATTWLTAHAAGDRDDFWSTACVIEIGA